MNQQPIEDQVLELFRDSTVPAGPPRSLVDSTIARLDAEIESEAIATESRRPHLPAWRMAAAVTVAAIVIGLVWFEAAVNSSNLAFAQVQEKAGKTRTVQFTEVLKRPEEKRELKEGEEEIDDSDAYHPRRHLVSGRHLQRIEALGPAGQVLHISISNAKTGKNVSIEPAEKKFVILATQVSINLDTGKTTETKIGPNPGADFTAFLSEVPAQATRKLPLTKIGDREVVGFLWEEKIEKKHGVDTWKRSYWVDPKSQMIVQVEVSYRSTDPQISPSDWVKTDFVFDKELPESLFSTEPPEGYSVETQAIYGIQID